MGYRQRSPTSKTITGELIPRVERKRSRYERATTEWKAQGEGPRTSSLIIAQRTRVSADRVARSPVPERDI